MNNEMKWGAAGMLALAAAIGISSQSGGRPSEDAVTARQARPEAAQTKNPKTRKDDPCDDLIDLFQAFWPTPGSTSPLQAPKPMSKPAPKPAPKPTSGKGSKEESNCGMGQIFLGPDIQPKFVIATLPDPLHTHFSLLFDRFIEAIQQGSQDEDYEYDSSWLPWETEEPDLVRLTDQDLSDERKKNREEQPGVLLFRKAAQPGQNPALQPYQQSLVVFIVGEDPTHGIHGHQFENAVRWISSLKQESASVAILGPSFSGSFPSLAELLADQTVRENLLNRPGAKLTIYSGSVSSRDAANWFTSKSPNNFQVKFRSFLQDDDTALRRFCDYLSPGTPRLAVLSEDETAYGYSMDNARPICRGATWLYYPRDISTLRAAYQKQSIFSLGTPEQQSQNSGAPRTLPTDLADPEGKEHDTVRSYAGNQTSLAQEAELLGIVGALRSRHEQYVVLRSSNTLDSLFLANFLRREYPEGRIVILNSDLLFQRTQDALQLSGVMTLST
jgi:hypothetical protein